LAAVAEEEGRMISERTKAALAARKERLIRENGGSLPARPKKEKKPKTKGPGRYSFSDEQRKCGGFIRRCSAFNSETWSKVFMRRSEGRSLRHISECTGISMSKVWKYASVKREEGEKILRAKPKLNEDLIKIVGRRRAERQT
jgi:DNA invertase Pin-like site-specific DNA recombinase